MASNVNDNSPANTSLESKVFILIVDVIQFYALKFFYTLLKVLTIQFPWLRISDHLQLQLSSLEYFLFLFPKYLTQFLPLNFMKATLPPPAPVADAVAATVD